MKNELVKIVVFTPEKEADKIRQALGEAGAGKMGHYDFCSFSVKGMGRFRPLQGAKPAIGQINRLEKVKEERIEAVCFRKDLKKVIKAIKKVHAYEEPAIDIYPLVGKI